MASSTACFIANNHGGGTATDTLQADPWTYRDPAALDQVLCESLLAGDCATDVRTLTAQLRAALATIDRLTKFAGDLCQ